MMLRRVLKSNTGAPVEGRSGAQGVRPFHDKAVDGFCYLPQQFLLVSEGDKLKEVFPCRIGDSHVEPLENLERVERGRPWTSRSRAGMAGKKHTPKFSPGPTCLNQD